MKTWNNWILTPKKYTAFKEKKNQIIGSPPALQSLFHVLAFKTISFYIIGISLFTDMFLTSNKACETKLERLFSILPF